MSAAAVDIFSKSRVLLTNKLIHNSGGDAGMFSPDTTDFMEPTISSLMQAAEQGDASAADALFAMLYSELHALARSELRHGNFRSTLSATTLLHEAYLDIAGRGQTAFPDRARFMSYASRVMRGLIIDHARRQCAQKRGGQFEITSLDCNAAMDTVDHGELTQISDALDELASAEPSLVEVVDLKFFCGFSFAEIAAMRDVSERTVQRNWEKARIFLHRSLQRDLPR